MRCFFSPLALNPRLAPPGRPVGVETSISTRSVTCLFCRSAVSVGGSQITETAETTNAAGEMIRKTMIFHRNCYPFWEAENAAEVSHLTEASIRWFRRKTRDKIPEGSK